jgi:hypothetical protein
LLKFIKLSSPSKARNKIRAFLFPSAFLLVNLEKYQNI